MSEYPEHEKLEKVKEDSQAIGAFLEQMSYEGIFLAEYEGNHLYRISGSINEILAKYFEIDLNKLEQEKRQMLEELRK